MKYIYAFVVVWALSMFGLLYYDQAKAAGPYLDLGIGWLDDMPARTEVKQNGTTIFSSTGQVNIDSPYLDLAVGYEWKKNFYIEYRRFGTDLNDPNAYLGLFKFGKRFYFN